MTEETLSFEADVAKLLDIVVNALYSRREIFLRELISNASDACDKLRYAAIAEPSLIAGDADFRVRLSVDKDGGTLTVADNGIGMSREDLIENLGSIGHSGAAEFLKNLTGEAKNDITQIGQFGVGFYSTFMVADAVEVLTRKAGAAQGWKWSSEGKGAFTLAEAPQAARGAAIVLRLKKDAREFLDPSRLRHVVKQYSDHIGLPVTLSGHKDDKGETVAEETLNQASALWTRDKSEISKEQYKEFYRHVAHAFDDPWLTLHYRAEGAIEYAVLLFVPEQKPFDLFASSERRNRVRLYVNRVFIADDCDGLLPPWLRFARGVVDSADLPLNVSRETLQDNPVLTKIRNGLVKRLLSELKKKAEDANAYAAFWANFGAVLKEGLYDDFARRDDILPLCRFHSTHGEDLVSLKGYGERMKDGQDKIYFITGNSVDALRKSPQLEGYVAKGIEVLLLDDPIDEFWSGTGAPAFEGKAFASVAQGAADLDTLDAAKDKDDEKKDDAPPDRMEKLIAAMTAALGDSVTKVRVSSRLTSSPCCLVADTGQTSMRLERLMRQHQGDRDFTPARILEINPAHGLIKGMAARAATDAAAAELTDLSFLLLDQARILEGEPPTDSAAFARRMSQMMTKSAGL